MTAPKNKEPVVKEPETLEPETLEPESLSVRISVLEGKFRHPVTGTLFRAGSIVDVVDLNSTENAFVRHQIEAGLFKVLD